MEFVCGVTEHRVKAAFARGWWSWPFGRIELRESELHAYAPVFFGRVAVGIPYAEITKAVPKPHRLGGTVRLQRKSAYSGDVSLVTIGDSYLRVAGLLREKGVNVTSDP